MRRHPWLIAAVLLIGLWAWSQRGAQAPTPSAPASGVPAPSARTPVEPPSPLGAPERNGRDPAPPIAALALPPQAADTLRRIAAGGPFAHRQDGSVFQNRERRLPRQPRGYYREYTVETPGENDRGARRIVTGGDPPGEYYYTGDHYRSFTRFEPKAGAR